jgi:hypothetical protein
MGRTRLDFSKNAIQIAQGICQASVRRTGQRPGLSGSPAGLSGQLESLDREFEAVVDHAGTARWFLPTGFLSSILPTITPFMLQCLHGCSAVTEPSLTAIAGLD